MNTIINLTPKVNGAIANQTGDFSYVPDGWAKIPDELVSMWEQHAPFVTLTIEDGAITAIADNADARNAQKAADAEVESSADPSTETDLMSMAVDHEYRLTLLELGVTE